MAGADFTSRQDCSDASGAIVRGLDVAITISKMTLYHRTSTENARNILRDGFKDQVGHFLSDHFVAGVWFSDRPVDLNEGARGETVFRIVVDVTESDLSMYEWVEEEKPNREWLIPADFINSRKLSIEVIEE